MHVEGLERDDVVVVVQFARLGAEAQVGYGGQGNRPGFEARVPLVDILVLELDLQRLFLIVGQSYFGWDGCGSKPFGLSEMSLVIFISSFHSL